MDMRALMVLVMVAAYPSSAFPCLNGVLLERDEAVQLLVKAERAVERGKPRRALALLTDQELHWPDRRLERRGERIVATAHLRLGHTRRAERMFRRELRRHPEDPWLLTRLGEALADRKGGDAIEAYRILDGLEERDLIADAEGYAALARLRARAGQTEAFDRAVTRCRAMARDARICPGPTVARR